MHCCKSYKRIHVVHCSSMPSFLETPSRIQLAGQNELIEIAYEMINTT